MSHYRKSLLVYCDGLAKVAGLFQLFSFFIEIKSGVVGSALVIGFASH